MALVRNGPQPHVEILFSHKSSSLLLHHTVHKPNMPPPSQLSIATSAVNRLLKEEVTYRTELANQEKRLTQMEEDKGDDENREFGLKQEVC